MTEITRRILIFAVIFTLFFTAFPVFFGAAMPSFPLVQTADVIEFFSTFFIIPVYWLVYEGLGKGGAGRKELLAFILLTTLLAVADGVHLAGNSIQHLMVETKNTPSFRLAFFYHKPFSHYALGMALVGLSTILIRREADFEPEATHSLLPEAFSALLYGFSFFCFTISGKVTLLGFPYSLAVAAVAFLRRKGLRGRPVLAFFGMAYLISFLLSLGWGIYWKGFPNFDEVGLPS